MAECLTFTADSVKNFLIEHGGEVTNRELVEHFKPFLFGPDSLNAKIAFKDFVSSVATIKQQDGVKYVTLKKRIHDETSASNNNIGYDSGSDVKKCKLSSMEVGPTVPSPAPYSLSNPPVFGASRMAPETSGAMSRGNSIKWSSDLPAGHVPQAPPRRKHSMRGKENAEKSPNDVHALLSPGSVKEKAHRLNKMANEQEIQPLPRKNHGCGRRLRDRDQGPDDDDTSSISTLDPRRKEWILKSCQCDYHELVRLLREEPKLAHVRDVNKYTALHWAAKHGNLDVIKLMAGTHKIDPNLRTSGGYTALHIAAMFGREEIMEVLINTYGADPGLRDHSGKRALSYLPHEQAHRFLSMFPALSYPILLCGKNIMARGEDKDSTLTRAGSLNSKGKKSIVLSASGRAITRMKSWGSADNIQDRAVNLMPPPKTFPKKKKSRKHADIIGFTDHWRGRSPDSDSDNGMGIGFL